MKARFGFVSNSSGASFIVMWAWNTSAPENETSVVRAVRLLLDDGGDAMIAEQADIIENTSTVARMKDGVVFETRFRTYMLNSPSNFGSAAAHLLLALDVSEHEGEYGIRKVKTELEPD